SSRAVLFPGEQRRAPLPVMTAATSRHSGAPQKAWPLTGRYAWESLSRPTTIFREPTATTTSTDGIGGKRSSATTATTRSAPTAATITSTAVTATTRSLAATATTTSTATITTTPATTMFSGVAPATMISRAGMAMTSSTAATTTTLSMPRRA